MLVNDRRRSELSVVYAVAHGAFGRACLYALDRAMVPHAHREGHLLFHLGGPAAAVVVDGRTVPLSPGGGVAVSPWQSHYFRTVGGVGRTLALVLYIRPQWFGDESGHDQAELRFGRPDVKVTEQIDRLVRQMRFLLAEQGGATPNFGQCLTELVRASHRQTWACIGDGPCGPGHRPRIFDFRIRRAVRLLDETLGEPIDLAALSRSAGLSRPHFFKLFREQIGVPPTIYANTLRMERAIDRLVTGEENVAEIGLDLGFSSPASFSRFFVANSVVPPSAYRRSLRGQALH
jgi:AraC-like DNA-binding protein